jgi:hypothetical protein
MVNKKIVNPVIFLVAIAIVFFILSAVFMALWNGVVKKAFRAGTINKLSYPEAMGMTLFVSLFFGGTVVITDALKQDRGGF